VAPVKGRPAGCRAGVDGEAATILPLCARKVLLRFGGTARFPEDLSFADAIDRKSFGADRRACRGDPLA
jgi:hypothetical protein